MARFSALVLSVMLSAGEAFVPSSPIHRHNAVASAAPARPSSTTSLDAAPAMFIYCSIKTAIDTIAYGVGATDEVKGTGVWSAFELKRDSKDDDEDEEEK